MNLDDIDLLIELAFEVEAEDPIDWDKFKEGKGPLLRMLAASLLEQYSQETDHRILLAVILKLVAENTILHSKELNNRYKK
jgi:hypothetical protein